MNNQQTTYKSDPWIEIQSGRFQESYLIYCRKSTDEANNQKNSITYQKTENLIFAEGEELSIAPISIKGFCKEGIISEKHSGFKEDDSLSFTDEGLVQYRIERPKFQKLLELLNKGCFKGVVCLCWDRISRNKGDDTIIRKLMRRGVDIQFVYAKYDKTSSGALHMDIDGMFSQHHSRVTSEKVRLATINNKNKGLCTSSAPIGYLNIGKMDHKPLDSERAPIIKEMFRLYDNGNWSLSDLARYANNEGMTTVPRRQRRTKEELLDEDLEIKDLPKITKPISISLVSRILSNVFYSGFLKDGQGILIQSVSHKALVDLELFNRVQSMLKKRNVSIHYNQKIDLPLRGIMRCRGCKRIYTPYVKKGIQYYYARCQAGCTNPRKSLSFDEVSQIIGERIKKIYFTADEISFMDTTIESEISLLEERRNTELVSIERKKRKIREDLTYLRANKLSLLKSGVYGPQDYMLEENKLSATLEELQSQEQESDQAMHELMKELIKLSELVKTLSIQYDYAEPREKDEIIRILFSELWVSENTLEYILNSSVECLKSRFAASCGLLEWLSELWVSQYQISDKVQELENCLTQFNHVS